MVFLIRLLTSPSSTAAEEIVFVMSDRPIPIGFGDSLLYAHLREACHTLRSGGVCLLPSDTAHSLAALPSRRDAVERIAQLRQAVSSDEPISLAFGSLRLVERFAHLTDRDYRLIDAHCPGPLSLVCTAVERLEASPLLGNLRGAGAMIVRIPNSPVERQLSTELEGPITTALVRSDDGQPLRAFDDALAVVRGRMKARGESFPLLAVKMNRLMYSDLSTIVTVQPSVAPGALALREPYKVFVFRPGVIDPEELEHSLQRFSLSDLEDWA